MDTMRSPFFTPLFLVLGCLALAGRSTAHADMVVVDPALAIEGVPATVRGVPTEVTFVVRNTGRAAETVTEPHLVLLDGGIRIPLTITRYEVDGAAHGRFEALTLEPGRSIRVRAVFTGITDRGERSWELALSFRGVRSPASVMLRRG